MGRVKNYHHFHFRSRNCLVCGAAAEITEASAVPVAGFLKSGKLKAGHGQEAVPMKYLAGWIVKNLPLNLQKVIFEFECPGCRKSFREYLLSGPIKCGGCLKKFLPLILKIYHEIRTRKTAESPSRNI